MDTWVNIFIIFLSVITIIGCFWCLTACLKNKTGVPVGEEMDHTFDGIVEMNNPLPAWWTYMFYFIIFWSVIYLILYPGLGTYKGLFNWRSANIAAVSVEDAKQQAHDALSQGVHIQYDQEIIRAEEKFGPIFNQYFEQDMPTLVKDDSALKIGKRLYLQNCAQCHGSDARGVTGYPDLTDDDWLYGGSPDKIKESIMHGRIAAMPGWQDALGDDGVRAVTAYVRSLSGQKVDQALSHQGKEKFVMCAGCHGADGKGSLAHNLPIGAPDLTDNVWLYGGSPSKVTESIKIGRAGVMPPWNDILGEKKIHLITAYIYSLSQESAPKS